MQNCMLLAWYGINDGYQIILRPSKLCFYCFHSMYFEKRNLVQVPFWMGTCWYHENFQLPEFSYLWFSVLLEANRFFHLLHNNQHSFPFKVFSMLPGFSQELMPKGREKESQAKIKRYMTMMDSMTNEGKFITTWKLIMLVLR